MKLEDMYSVGFCMNVLRVMNKYFLIMNQVQDCVSKITHGKMLQIIVEGLVWVCEEGKIFIRKIILLIIFLVKGWAKGGTLVII